MIKRDVLFKGCTRPAMVMGVPLVPLTIVASIIILAAIWTKIFFAVLLIPIILVMRLIAKNDDQQFRLLGLKTWFRVLPNFNFNQHYWKTSTYSPSKYKKRFGPK